MKKSGVLGLVGATVFALGAGVGPVAAAQDYQSYGGNNDPYYNNGYRADSGRGDNYYGGPSDRGTPARIVRCESRNDRTAYCGPRVDGNVRLVRQMSQSSCVRGRTWGVDRDRLWVSRGCRAQFAINERYDGRDDRRYGYDRGSDYGYGQGNGQGNGYGYQDRNAGRVLVCESRDGRYNFCGAYGGIRQVQVRRQLSKSACQQNFNWGYRRDGVWVDGGCRAEFVIY